MKSINKPLPHALNFYMYLNCSFIDLRQFGMADHFTILL